MVHIRKFHLPLISSDIESQLKAFISNKGDIRVPYYLSYFPVGSEPIERMMLFTEPLKDPIHGERLPARVIKLVE